MNEYTEYQRQNWYNLPDQSTPVSADRINHIEEGLSKASQKIIEVDNKYIIGAKLLWTNPKPSATFGVQQITLNSNDYDIIEWFVALSNSSGTLTSVRTIKGHSVKILGISSVGNYRSRVLTYNSDTQYTSEQCYIPNNATDNSQMIPLYAIGYKTGLF